MGVGTIRHRLGGPLWECPGRRSRVFGEPGTEGCSTHAQSLPASPSQPPSWISPLCLPLSPPPQRRTVNLCRSRAHISSQTLPCSRSLSSSSATCGQGVIVKGFPLKKLSVAQQPSMPPRRTLPHESLPSHFSPQTNACMVIARVIVYFCSKFHQCRHASPHLGSPCCIHHRQTWCRHSLRPGSRCGHWAMLGRRPGGPGRSI